MILRPARTRATGRRAAGPIGTGPIGTGLIAAGLLAAGLTAAGPAAAEPSGWLDRGFGVNGTATVPETGFTPFAEPMAVDPLGRTLLLQQADQDLPILLTRITEGGAPDPAFGTGGQVRITELLRNREPEGIVATADGGVLAYSSTFGGLALAKVTGTGGPNLGFGSSGSIIPPTPCGSPGGFHEHGIAVSPAGAVAIWCSVDALSSAIVLLTPRGAVDPRFNPDGISPGTLVTTGVRVDALVFAGTRLLVSAAASGGFGPHEVRALTLAGTPVPTFGTAGTVAFPTGTGALAADGTAVLVAGRAPTTGSGSVQTLTRLSAGGVPDPAFGTAGVARMPQPTCGGPPRILPGPRYVHVVVPCGFATVVGRLTRAGRPDRGFGSGGQLDLAGTEQFSADGTGQGPAGAALTPGETLLLGFWGNDGTRTLLGVTRLRAGSAVPPGGFTAMPGTALLSTATGLGAPAGAVPAGAMLTVTVAGRAQLPATGVGTVLLNLRVSQATGTGDLLVGSAGGPVPGVPAVPVDQGRTTVNQAVVALGTGGAVTFTNRSSGPVQLTASVAGWYRAGPVTAAGAFVPLPGSRLLDATVAPAAGVQLAVAGRGGVPVTGVSAVLLDLSGTAAGDGQVAAFAAGSAVPGTTALWVGPRPTSTLATVALGPQGAVRLLNRSGPAARLTADVLGYYLGGTPDQPGTYVPVTPTRVKDTRLQRNPAGGPDPLPAGQGQSLGLHLGLPGAGPAAVQATVMVTAGTRSGVVSLHGISQTAASATLPYSAGRTGSVPAVVPASAGSGFASNASTGTVDLVLDVTGWFRP